jgi:hypothetical protein
MNRAFLAAAALLVTLAGCSYGPPTWTHRVMNAMPQPREHRFAIIVLSTQAREPQGLAAFPDGGKRRVLRETAKLWLCDADARTTRLMARIERPGAVKSEYSAWIVGWDSVGDWRSIYLDVRGRAGETSDTAPLRWLLAVEVGPDTSRAIGVPYLPRTADEPRGSGPLRGGRELQVSAGDTIAVRTDLRPEFHPAFRIDAASGDVVAMESSSP